MGVTQHKTRDVAGILRVLTPRQMAEEIIRLDAVLAGEAPNITIGRVPIIAAGCEWARGCAMDCCPEKKAAAGVAACRWCDALPGESHHSSCPAGVASAEQPSKSGGWA